MKSDKELFELWHRQKFGHFQRDADHFSLIEAAFLHAIAKGREMERERCGKLVEGSDTAPMGEMEKRVRNIIAAAIRNREGEK